MAYSVPYGYFDEGQQAEEYKKRKAKEAEDKNQEELDRFNRRYAPIGSTRNGNTKMSPTGFKNDKYRNPNRSEKGAEEDERRATKASHMVNNDEYNKDGYGRNPINKDDYAQGHKSVKPDGYYGPSSDVARDAANRHMRRHPDQYKESTIFESVEFI